ncbi:hypothetical protein NP233_g8489 [Leucocoprinus birnbaumii]|uniref:Uncharacterized protein n=1 Tax=Leucocoprinus birnbaumii TaxID=56174 RepID=A0AAD5VMV8_9AGAR|nr:hypothetical protein NP233_g8489 [Leucocoprinus birnbaumii]
MTYPESVTESNSGAPSEPESDGGSESACLPPTHSRYFPLVHMAPDCVPQAKDPHTSKFYTRYELNIINSATHQALVSSGNELYAQVLYEAQLMQAELKAFSATYRLLCGILDKKIVPSSNAADVLVPRQLATMTPSVNTLALDMATISFASPPAAKTVHVKSEFNYNPSPLKAAPCPSKTIVQAKPALTFPPVKVEELNQSLIPSSQMGHIKMSTRHFLLPTITISSHITPHATSFFTADSHVYPTCQGKSSLSAWQLPAEHYMQHIYSQNELLLLRAATHLALISSGNEPYIQLHQQLIYAQAEAQSLRTAYDGLLGTLSQKIAPATNTGDIPAVNSLAQPCLHSTADAQNIALDLTTIPPTTFSLQSTLRRSPSPNLVIVRHVPVVASSPPCGCLWKKRKWNPSPSPPPIRLVNDQTTLTTLTKR